MTEEYAEQGQKDKGEKQGTTAIFTRRRKHHMK
jgi:hypothetical protein